jgi:hypothetical protein
MMPTLKELLLTDAGRGELSIAPRGRLRRRSGSRRCDADDVPSRRKRGPASGAPRRRR